MPLLEMLAGTLGPALAKALTKLWLKDIPFVSESADAAIELAKKKYGDFVATRGAKRLLEDMQFDVVQRLGRVIEIEFAALSESDVESAVRAVADAMNELPVLEQAVGANLDATSLYLAVDSRTSGAFKSLGGDVQALANLLLRESTAYVVALAGKLPNFNVAATRELLKRTDDLLKDMGRVLDDVESIRHASKSMAQVSQQHFETDYRRTLLLVLDRMELFGVRLAGGGARHWALSVAYVTLSSRKKHVEHLSSVDICLAGETALVVRGEAGSGKTTLLHWLAVRASARDFPDSLRDWNHLVPFYIRLRDYAEGGRALPTPKDFLNSCANNLLEVMPDKWAYEVLRSGALLLVDGIDELPQARRGDFLKWITAIKTEFPLCVILVTSRPAALDSEVRGMKIGAHLTGLGFAECSLEPMTPSHSAALVDQWHEAVGRDLGDQNERINLGKYATSLQRTLRERPAVQSLASNPLLCSMICALNWDQKQHLPDDRMELYKLAIHMLVHARDAERGIDPDAAGRLKPAQRLILLEALAYWMLRNGYSEAPFDQCAQQLELPLKRLSMELDPAEILQSLLERSGVLRQPSGGMVDFVHRTFLEYLASRAAIDHGDIGLLVDKSREEGWREVVVFATGHAYGAARDHLIDGLLRRPWLGIGTRSFESEVTTVCCLETAGAGLDPKVSARLLDRASELFPPQDVTLARLLAPAAALMPHRLMGHSVRGWQVVAACIRCAASVGGPQMLEVIASYANVHDREVAAERLAAWTSFDEERYLKGVVGTTRWDSFHDLTLNQSRDEDIQRFFFLATTEGMRFGTKEFHEALRLFISRRELRVTFRTAADVDRIAKIKSVATLDILNCVPGVVQQLRGLKNLRTLLCECLTQHAEAIAAEVAELPNIAELILQGRRTELAVVPSKSHVDLRIMSKSSKLAALSVRSFGGAQIFLPYSSTLRATAIMNTSLSTVEMAGLNQSTNLERLVIDVSTLPLQTISFSQLKKLRTLEVKVSHRSELEVELPLSIESITFSGFHRLKITNAKNLRHLTGLALERIDEIAELEHLLDHPLKHISLRKIVFSKHANQAIQDAKYRLPEFQCDWLN